MTQSDYIADLILFTSTDDHHTCTSITQSLVHVDINNPVKGNLLAYIMHNEFLNIFFEYIDEIFDWHDAATNPLPHKWLQEANQSHSELKHMLTILRANP